LTSEQHGIDTKIAKLIAYLNKRVEKLELEQRWIYFTNIFSTI